MNVQRSRNALALAFLVVALCAAFFAIINGLPLRTECSPAGDDWCFFGTPWYDLIMEIILPTIGALASGVLLWRYWRWQRGEGDLVVAAHWLHWTALAIFVGGFLYVAATCMAGDCDFGAPLLMFAIITPLAGVFFAAGIVLLAIAFFRNR